MSYPTLNQLVMLRRSTRKRTAVAAPATSDGPTSDDDDGEVGSSAQKSRKRPRTLAGQNNTIGPKKPTRRRRGVLKELLEMPFDILFEVCIYIFEDLTLHLIMPNRYLDS